jgi:hypothetical protein
VVHVAEALEDRDEAAVLPLGVLDVDDVVVEVVLARARGDGEELVARRVDDHRAQAPDLRRDVD